MSARRPPSLRAAAVGWLAQREYSVAEMRRKLLRRAQAGLATQSADEACLGDEDAADDPSTASDGARTEVEEVIDWLLQRGYLDEGRFVASRVHVRSAGHGLARIAQELSRHGLELPAETASNLRASELERAQAIWQRRFGAPPADAREAARQARFLAGRGFSADVVARILRAARRSARDEPEAS